MGVQFNSGGTGPLGTFTSLKKAEEFAKKHEGNELIVKDKATGEFKVYTEENFSNAKVKYNDARFEPLTQQFNITGQGGFIENLAQKTGQKTDNFELVEFSIDTEDVPDDDGKLVSAFKDAFNEKDMAIGKNGIPFLTPKKADEMLKSYNAANGTNYKDVKELQKALGVTADGLFGPETHKAYLSSSSSPTPETKIKPVTPLSVATVSSTEHETKLNAMANDPAKLNAYIKSMDVNSIGWLLSNSFATLDTKVATALGDALNTRKTELKSDSPYQSMIDNPTPEAIKHFAPVEHAARLNAMATDPEKLNAYIKSMDITDLSYTLTQCDLKPEVKTAMTNAVMARQGELTPSSPYHGLVVLNNLKNDDEINTHIKTKMSKEGIQYLLKHFADELKPNVKVAMENAFKKTDSHTPITNLEPIINPENKKTTTVAGTDPNPTNNTGPVKYTMTVRDNPEALAKVEKIKNPHLKKQALRDIPRNTVMTDAYKKFLEEHPGFKGEVHIIITPPFFNVGEQVTVTVTPTPKK